MTNPFAGVGQAKASHDNNYITPGHYISRVDAVKMKEDCRDGGDAFIVEMIPLFVLAEVDEPMNGIPTRSNKAGVKMSHVVKNAGPGKDYFLPNVKQFAETAIDGFAESSDEDQEKLLKRIVAEDQPLAGKVVLEVVARSIVAKGSKKDVTRVTFVKTIDNSDLLAMKLITQEEYDIMQKEQG